MMLLRPRSRRHVLHSLRPLVLLGLLFAYGIDASVAQTGLFAIWRGEARVGSLAVQRTYQGDRTLYAMISLSEVEVVLWKQVVRTAMRTEYVGDHVEACGSTVHLNNTLRDSSSMRTTAGVAQGYIHPGRVMQGGNGNAWTTARMYYEEPVGQESIYVESALCDCPLERIGEGIYRLLLPGEKVNRYVYRDGVLQEVHIDRSFIDLVFRRV
ncbi:MAG: hypothetical protein ABI432_19440 [Flavobacteriales bacterium]